MYCIKGNYYMYDPSKEDDCGKQPAYMGLEGEARIFVWDDYINPRTKFFETKEEAQAYLQKHYLNEHPDNKYIWGENLRVVEVRVEDMSINSWMF